MAAPGATGAITQYTTQYMQNYGFDDSNKVPVVEIVGVDSNGTLRRALLNSNGALVAEVGSTVYMGQKTVAVTGTALAIAATQGIKNGVIVQALAANAGNVVVGDSSVTTSNGFQLQPGQATSVAINDLTAVYVNGTAGDGVCYIAAN